MPKAMARNGNNPLKKKIKTGSRLEIKEIAVKNGKVEIGFVANGKANAFCYVDDVVFKRK